MLLCSRLGQTDLYLYVCMLDIICLVYVSDYVGYMAVQLF